jgi:hypothetical protein
MTDILPTARTHLAAHVGVLAICRDCGHCGWVDLDKLIEQGRGDIPLLHLRFTCTECRTRDCALCCGQSWRDQAAARELPRTLRPPLRCSAPCSPRRSVEPVRLGAHPREKPGDLRLCSKACDVREAAGEFGLSEPGMDRAMADLVQSRRAEMRAAFQPRHEMVTAGAGLGRDGPVAERANNIRCGCGGGRRSLGSAGTAWHDTPRDVGALRRCERGRSPYGRIQGLPPRR